MRTETIDRQTKETQIRLSLNLDGNGCGEITTGIGFFDHMLTLLQKHSGYNLSVHAKGDLEVDGHHLVEDVGICLGKALSGALGDKRGIARYGNAVIPMDEALCMVTLDLSGRAFFVMNAELEGKSGDFDMELVQEFFRAVATSGGITLHVNLMYGVNNHHKAEAIFKCFARALKAATAVTGTEIPSSKGILE